MSIFRFGWILKEDEIVAAQKKPADLAVAG
jgi:hypothetical protein